MHPCWANIDPYCILSSTVVARLSAGFQITAGLN